MSNRVCHPRGVPEPDALSLTDWVVLALVAEEPRHGFAVAKELAPDATLGEAWTVRRPLVYRAIDHLRDAGLVEPVRTEAGAQGPHRTVYRATRSGATRVTRWLDRPVADAVGVGTVSVMEKNPVCCIWLEVTGWTPNPGEPGYFVINQAGGSIISASDEEQLQKAVERFKKSIRKSADGAEVPLGMMSSYRFVAPSAADR